MRIVIIGSVASGPTAAAEARRAAPDADIVVYDQHNYLSVGACEMPYWIEGRLDDLDVLQMFTPAEFEQQKGARVRLRQRVLACDPAAQTLDVEDCDTGAHRSEPYDRLILATGAQARRLDVPGRATPGIFPLRRLDHAQAIWDWIETHAPERAVVVGGGYIGLEVAEALCTRGCAVTLLDRLGRVLPRILDDPLDWPMRAGLHAHGVTVERGSVARYEGGDDGDRIAAVVTEEGARHPADLVIEAVGLDPYTALADGLGVEQGDAGALAVDDHMATGVPHVWACGDAVTVRRVLDDRRVHWPLAPVGRATARVAARNAAQPDGAGPVAAHAGIVGTIGVRAFQVEVGHAGLTLTEAREAGFDAVPANATGYNRVRILPESHEVRVRLVVERGSGRLLGGTLCGRDGAALRANVLVPLLREGWTAQRMLDELEMIYNPPLAPAVDPLLRAAWQAKTACLE